MRSREETRLVEWTGCWGSGGGGGVRVDDDDDDDNDDFRCWNVDCDFYTPPSSLPLTRPGPANLDLRVKKVRTCLHSVTFLE